jgi:hypothetical protein
MDRIRELDLFLMYELDQEILDILGTYPAPLLERLQVRFAAAPRLMLLPDRLFAGNYPSLRELSLDNCDYWNFPSLDSLISLQISGSLLGRDRCPSLPQLTSLLSNTPNLERLKIDGVIPPSPPGTQAHSFTLLRLSNLSLRTKISECVGLLDHITYPATLSIGISSWGNIPYTLADILGVMSRIFYPEGLIGIRQPLLYLVLAPSHVNSKECYQLKGWDIPGSCSATPLGTPRISLDINNQIEAYRPWDEERCGEFWNIFPLEDLHCLVSPASTSMSRPGWAFVVVSIT